MLAIQHKIYQYQEITSDIMAATTFSIHYSKVKFNSFIIKQATDSRT